MTAEDARAHSPGSERVARRWRRAALVVAMLLLVVDARLLLRSPVLGMADNGDFWRVMHPAGIHYAEAGARTHAFVEQRFVTSEAHLAKHPSSPALIAWASRGLDFGALGSGVVDLRQTGIAYLLLLGGGAALLARASVTASFCGVLILWVVSAPAYLLFFNSFYADAAALVGSFGVVAWLLRQDGDPRMSRIGGASSLMLVFFAGIVAFSKASCSPTGVVAAIAVLGALRRARTDRTRSGRALLVATGAIALIAPVYFRWGGGHRFPRINRYDSVFAGVATVSDDPGAALQALGVPRDRRGLVGTSSFDSRVTEADRDTTRDVAPASVAVLYLEDPRAMFRAALRAGSALAHTHAFGGEHRSVQERDRSRVVSSGAPQFDSVRPFLLGRSWQVWAWIAAGIAWGVGSAVRRRSDALVTVTAYLVLTILTQIVVSVLGDGFFALARHLVVARLALDSLVVVLLVAFARWVAERARTGGNVTGAAAQDGHIRERRGPLDRFRD